MRLIHTQTIQLHEFNKAIPAYAILSHTWDYYEVTFQDIRSDLAVRKRQGFQKIEMMCRLASQHGFEFAWIDTCCIDKTSSAELSETN
jgi:hypothetical protein